MRFHSVANATHLHFKMKIILKIFVYVAQFRINVTFRSFLASAVKLHDTKNGHVNHARNHILSLSVLGSGCGNLFALADKNCHVGTVFHAFAFGMVLIADDSALSVLVIVLILGSC